MQVISLDNDKLIKNDSLWVYQDSLVDVWFYFYSDKGLDILFIENKINKPVFLDLKNSFISINNNRKDFWTDVSQLNGGLIFKQYKSITFKTQNPINASISRPDRIVMIPPNSVEKIQTGVNLQTQPFLMDSFIYKKELVSANWRKNKKTLVKSIDFSNQNSPSHFRFFLTTSKTEDFRNPFYHDLYFWVSNIMEMDARQGTQAGYPYDYLAGVYTSGDKDSDKASKHPYKKSWRFYLRKD